MIAAIAYLAFCAACVVLAFVRHPIYGMYFYFATIYVHPPSRWWGYMVPDLRWALLSAVVVALAILFNRGRLASKPLWLTNGAAKLLAAYAAWMLLQTFWAVDIDTHLVGAIQYTKYLAAFWFVYRILDTKENMRDLMSAHAIGCGLLGIYCALTGREGDRLDGVGGPGMDDANTLGMYLATGVIACMAIFLSSRGWRRWSALVVMAVIGQGFVLANSRGAFLGLAAGALVVAVCKAPAHRRMFWSLALVGVVGFAVIIDKAFVERMFTIGDVATKGEEAERSALSRVFIINAQIQMAQDYPMGTGHRGTATLSTRYLDREWLTNMGQGADAERSSHNTFMTSWVEQGIPGAIMFVLIVCWILFSVVRIRLLHRRGVDPELITLTAAYCATLVVVYVAGIATDYLLAEVQFWMFAGTVSGLQLAGAGSPSGVRAASEPFPASRASGAGFSMSNPGRSQRPIA